MLKRLLTNMILIHWMVRELRRYVKNMVIIINKVFYEHGIGRDSYNLKIMCKYLLFH